MKVYGAVLTIVFLMFCAATPALPQAPVVSLPPGSVSVSPVEAGPTYAQVTLSVASGATYSIWNSSYNGWCINPFASLQPYSASSYSSYDPALPTDEGGAVQWQKINWVLNHKRGNAGTLSTVTMDIQKTIWKLLFPTLYRAPLSATATSLLADANTYGAGFVPGPGQFMAIILYAKGVLNPANQTGSVSQDLIIEYIAGGRIGDFVWNNTAKDGLQNPGEMGINGVTVQLFNGATLVGTTITADAPAGYPYPGPTPAGYYQFIGLPGGAYTVVIPADQPALSGLYRTLSMQGGNPAADSNGVAGPSDSTVAAVTLATDWSIDETTDFGFYAAPQITLACPPAASIEVGRNYNAALEATGAIAPSVFSITSGSLPTGVTLNTSTGALTGTATAPGTYSFSAQVVDSRNNAAGTATSSCGVTVFSPPTADCVAIAAVEGVAIAPVTIAGSGGEGGPYTFAATGLPAGLTMSAEGTISGTPTASGTFNYSVTVTDKNGNTGTVNCSVTVAPPPTANCVAITAVEGVAITPVTLTGNGGAGAPYTFTATGLPAGLSISSSGTISGTPTVNGTFSYTVTVTDKSGDIGTVNCSVTVAPPVTANCVAITAVQGVAITPVTLTGNGGAGAPYTFTATGLPAGLSISSSGTISGTPTVNGTFSYTVTVTDKSGNTGTVNCSVTVAPPVTANCVAIVAVQGVAITPATLTGTGGAGAPYTFTATGLPAGLSISSSGTISGTPTVNGTFSYTVTVTDKSGNSGTVNCSVTVAPPVTANCVAITAVQGIAITPVTLTGNGGAGAPYTFTAAGLPAGLSISSSGTISGTPTVNGTFSYTVTLTDKSGNTGTVNCSVTVAPPVTANCVAIVAVQGLTIAPVTLTGNGGAGAPYTFTAAGLPAGLSISSSGTISGTPTVSGTFSYTVTVTDKSGNKGTVNCSVTVLPPVTANCASITAVQGVVITPVTVTASGGAGGPYTFTATGLPAGLSISASGTISGTPTVSGTFSYTVTVTDKSGNTGAVNCSVTVTPPTCSRLHKGDTATIGFWHNCNGQALIKALNGGQNSKALANWLAIQFPALYGPGSSHNMTNKTNADVAALFQTFFNVHGTKTDAQVLAGALAVYVTDSDLAGTVAKKYGFSVSTSGTGAKTYNVGSYGTAIGLSNNTSYTVLQLLYQANLMTQAGAFNANAFNAIFDDINQQGDIS